MSTKRTLDLLDAHFLSERTVNYDTLGELPRHKYSEEIFVIDPQYWERYYNNLSAITFNWSEFKFSSRPDLKAIIPNNYPGIYVFYIKPDNLIWDAPKFVLYVGISNENNSNRPLRKRLGDYFLVNILKKRDALHRLLGKYYNQTYVAFSTLNLNSTQLKEIETNLIGFYYPIANKDDFPVEIAKPKKAFNKR